MPEREAEEEVEPSILRAVEITLGAKALCASRIGRGTVNKSYKVETARGSVIVKVFRSGGWPEAGKLEWLGRQLKKYDIPHPRAIFYGVDADAFPNGLLITEHVEGEDAGEAIGGGRMTPEGFCEKLGSLLRRVHAVRVGAYGYLRGGAGVSPDFIGRRLEQTRDDVDQIGSACVRDGNLYETVKSGVRRLLSSYERSYRPVLTHGDPHVENCILQRDGRLVLTDWDNAASSIWLRDYAHLTYWGLRSAQTGAVGERGQSARGAFLKGYGAAGIDAEAICRIETAFHLIWAYNSLSDCEMQGDDDAAVEAGEVLSSLLSGC